MSRVAFRAVFRAVFCAVFCAALGGGGGPAEAQQQSLAQRKAEEGAAHFKAGRYLDAARAFERSYQLEPTDPVLLRYAGRAWQEVGHLARAKRLLERYLSLEKNAARRSSIEPKLAQLRGLDKTALAEALVAAVRRHPGGGLESDAAFALEDLGDKASLVKALEHWELARTLARTPSSRAQCESGIRRVKARIAELDRAAPTSAPKPRPEPEVRPPPDKGTAPPPPRQTPRPAGVRSGGGAGALTAALYVAGGLGLVAGAGLSGWGYIRAEDANRAFKADAGQPQSRRTYESVEAYQKDKSDADRLAYLGYGVAGVGAVAALWAIVRTAGSEPAPAGAVSRGGVAPWVDAAGRAGAVWTMGF